MYDIIFSDKRAFRIERHVIFWMVFYIYQVVRMSFLIPPNNLGNSIGMILLSSLAWGVFHNVFITYTTTYYLVPKFFIKKNIPSL
ncbi:MAG: hypothetical protein M3R50_03355 [Bacteroidota bacterium]|nr:hypothetical protein [Bacteroidota bacterium]